MLQGGLHINPGRKDIRRDTPLQEGPEGGLSPWASPWSGRLCVWLHYQCVDAVLPQTSRTGGGKGHVTAPLNLILHLGVD